MVGNLHDVMAYIDREYAERMEASRRALLSRHDPETVDILMASAERVWRTERQQMETSLRDAILMLNE